MMLKEKKLGSNEEIIADIDAYLEIVLHNGHRTVRGVLELMYHS